MQIEPEHMAKIKELAGQIECPWESRCITSDFTDVPKVEDTMLSTRVKCLAPREEFCPLSVHSGSEIFCKCSVRICLARKLGI